MESAGGNQGSMSFVLPSADAGAPPTPLDGSDIVIEKVPGRLVAAKPFPGIVTDEEVERQKAALLEALATDGSVEPVDESQVIVLQYNSPLTVPWRRRNEVTMVVAEKSAEKAPESRDSSGSTDSIEPAPEYIYSAEKAPESAETSEIAAGEP